jgi:hypothetical protein
MLLRFYVLNLAGIRTVIRLTFFSYFTFTNPTPMAAAFFNFVVGLLGLTSLGLLLFSIVLLVISFVRKSRRQRILAFRLMIGPIVYLVGMISLFRFSDWRYNRKMMPSIAGKYQYSFNDTFRLIYVLRSDNTFVIKSPTINDSGTWAIGANTYIIRFYHPDKIEFTRSFFKMTSAKPSLLFLNGKDTIELIKQR